MIRSVLVANRGEIAVRIIRACRSFGIRTIAVYSDADRHAPHVVAADEAWRIGGPAARDSYLRIDAILDAARQSGAEAIHPGYGFLSEKPELATACVQAGLIFIGPSADRIAAMGSKIGAKRIAAQAGVPSVPGYIGDDQSDTRFLDEANRIGYPLMVKASAGGGGRGMRRVYSHAELAPALDLARREAEAAFGDPSLLIEKLVLRPRHLEVQIAGDRHGNIVHLFERDCSVQRNNQKLLEEAPAPNLPAIVREKLLDRAVRLGKAIAYDNLGTVEFILDEGEDEPWFLEMNTRLQVEHPVTEAITGLDLVEWQLRIASGEPLPCRQDQIVERGHAIEARIVAEDPEKSFQPSSGLVTGYRSPSTIRVDSGIATGSEVTLYYDSLLAKAIACGADRAESLARLASGLRDFVIAGPATSIPFLIDSIEAPVFVEGRATTRFIDETFPGGWKPRSVHARVARAVAAALSLMAQSGRGSPSPWARLAGFRLLAPSGGLAESRIVVREGAASHRLRVAKAEGNEFRVHDDDGETVLSIAQEGSTCEIAIGDRVLSAAFEASGNDVHLLLAGESYSLEVIPEHAMSAGGASANASGAVVASMPGIVAELRVKPGDRVEAGQVVAILESMKLFISLPSEAAGEVVDVACRVGDTVQAGATLIRIDPASDGASAA